MKLANVLLPVLSVISALPFVATAALADANSFRLSMIHAGAIDELHAESFSCQTFVGQHWLNDPHGIYPSYEDNSIWTCSDDFTTVYKLYCQPGKKARYGGCF